MQQDFFASVSAPPSSGSLHMHKLDLALGLTKQLIDHEMDTEPNQTLINTAPKGIFVTNKQPKCTSTFLSSVK
jgi:hypothetical protein